MPRALLLLAAVGLFVVWSNSFIAASYLLGGEGRPAQLDWVSLSIARFAPIGPALLAWCFFFKRRQSLALLVRHPVRLILCGLLGAPVYNLGLYYGQQHGVPPPVASLTTALLPLFVMLLAAAFLGESLTRRRLFAFTLAVGGLVVISLSKGEAGSIAGYGRVLAITAVAPLSWSLYTILSKPVMARESTLVWTYLGIGIGSLPLLGALPFFAAADLRSLTLDGWIALLYLSILCTVVGYAVWVWLLRHLPASTLGFTVFLNPPLTTVSKLALALLLPGVFVWRLDLLEWVGGGLSLAGLALAVTPRKVGQADKLETR